MKSTLVALMLLSGAAAAASFEETYFAARDAYIDKLKPPGINVDVDEAVLKQEQLARADLEKQLRQIVGPVEIKGFAAPGKSNLDTLFKGDQGFGLLDGLVYSSTDDKTHVVVTTDAL